MVHSTYIGGSSFDYGYDSDKDVNGNIYITGRTFSLNYDIVTGAYQTTNAGYNVVFVTKLNASGTGLLYSTFIGGCDDDNGLSISIDNTNNAYITGGTASNDYDITVGAFQTTKAGSWDIFVTKLNSSGTGLIYSTYIGGNNYELAYGIAVDNNGNAFVTGQTNSTDYDGTPGAFQLNNGGSDDIFITKLNSTGSGLVYSTFIGGNGSETGYKIITDGSGNAYITGFTASNDYDLTTGAYQSIYGGGFSDVIVTKINSSGTGLIYSTYIGGSGDEYGYGLAVDASGNAYITGYTDSNNYDITVGAFQTTYGGGTYDMFVSKLNSSGTGLLYSTFLGGNGSEIANSITIDANGNAFIVGNTSSFDFDITPGSYQTNFEGGSFDACLVKLNSSGTGLLYSTFLGGFNADYGVSIKIDTMGNAYIMGHTNFTDFDVRNGSYQTTIGGSADVFVTKLGLVNVSVTEYDIENIWNIYPNPSNGTFVIDLPYISNIEVLDISGKIVYKQKVENGKNRIILNLPRGIYMLKEPERNLVKKLVLVP